MGLRLCWPRFSSNFPIIVNSRISKRIYTQCFSYTKMINNGLYSQYGYPGPLHSSPMFEFSFQIGREPLELLKINNRGLSWDEALSKIKGIFAKTTQIVSDPSFE